MSEVTLVDVPALLVLGMRKKGHYAETSSVIGDVVQYAMASGAQLAGPPMVLMHEPGGEAAMKADSEGTAVIDVAFPIAKPVRSGELVRCYELPGGRMARIVHKGPYDACGPAYNALFGWLATQGLRVTGPPREVSLNDPRTVKPEELLIEIYAPVD